MNQRRKEIVGSFFTGNRTGPSVEPGKAAGAVMGSIIIPVRRKVMVFMIVFLSGPPRFFVPG